MMSGVRMLLALGVACVVSAAYREAIATVSANPHQRHSASAADFGWLPPDLFIGTAGTAHCTPAAAVPFGAIQAGPDTGILAWKYCSGYQQGDTRLIGFSSTHISGSGCADLGDVRLLPSVGVPTASSTAEMDKATECAEPGSYAVTLEDGIVCEMTATKRAGLFRFTYPQGKPRRLLVDLQFGVVCWGEDGATNRVKTCAASATPMRIAAALEVKSWATRHVFEDIRFSAQSLSIVELPKTNVCERAPRYVLDFGPSDGTPLFIATGFSTVDAMGAARAVDEAADFDFDRVLTAAREEWADVLSRVKVEGSEKVRRLAATALYHLAYQPHDFADVDGRYRGAEGRVHVAKGGTHYGGMSLWDTYRAAHPLYTVLFPERVEGFVESLLAMSEEQGYLPCWPVRGQETDCMVGNPCASVIADAWAKGFRGFDSQRALRALEKSLDVARPSSRVDLVKQYGYFPFDLVPVESVSMLLEDAVNCDGAARFARAVGDEKRAENWSKRAQGYRMVFDTETGFFRGRDAKGRWREPFDPLRICNAYALGGDYTEGNAWQYLWHVQHDVDGLIRLLGGREKFLAKLETLFALPSFPEGRHKLDDVSGLIGQYAHGNEPSQHVAYLFALADKPRRTAELVREICDTLYKAEPDGICGNEDAGQMSAWYLFSIAGLYPVNPAAAEYVLGAPQAASVIFKVVGGEFKVLAKGLSSKAKYVKSISLNGRPYTAKTLPHALFAAGGELVFEMTEY